MYFGLPIITHPSEYFNGHLEVVEDNGFVANDCKEYAKYMKMFMDNDELIKKCADASTRKFHNHYEFVVQMKHIMDIYDDVIENPYPNKLRITYYDIIQRVGDIIKKIAISFYLCSTNFCKIGKKRG